MDDQFDALPCGFVSFRDNGTTVFANRTLLSWVGFEKEELTGKSVENIFTLATRIFYNTHFFPLIRLHSRATEIFLTLRTKTDQEVPVLANAERVSDGYSFIINCVFMQVNERRKYEQEILKAKRDAEDALKENRQLVELTNSMELQAIKLEQQYRSQLDANENFLQFGKIISHDLQEPIRKVQIYADMILRDTQTVLTNRSKNYVKKIIASGEKLKLLTSSLHQYISIDSDKTLTQVDLNDVIRSASEKAKNSRHFFDFEIDIDKMPNVEGYPTQLELMFFHLIDNAIQFRSPDRKLSLKIGYLLLEQNMFRASKDRYKYVEHVRISVSDNGIGFSEVYRDYVFELLKKGDNSSKGLGLGLSLVKKVASNHSGNVHIDSQPGIGTRIEIEIPSRKAPV